jgi:hypothetical protein
LPAAVLPRDRARRHAGLDEEAGLERWEIEEAVSALRAKGLIEYWELQPAVRLTPEGLRAVLCLPEEGDA